ncbi:MAG: hypothetical protein ACX93T_02275 [Bacteroidota bacterium]
MFYKYTGILKVWIVLLIAHTAGASSAHGKPLLRNAPGMQGIGINAGITSIGRSLDVDWSHYFSLHCKLKAGLGVELDSVKDNTYKNIFTQPVITYTVASNYRNWFLNVLGGAKLHFESHRSQKREAQYSTGNMGLVIGVETELFIAKNFEILLSGGGRMLMVKTPYGNLDYFLNLGLRYAF